MPQESLDSSSPDPVERRRDKTYRILFGARTDRLTSDITNQHQSAATDGVLQIDDEADLSPVVGEQISTVVRRKAGISTDLNLRMCRMTSSKLFTFCLVDSFPSEVRRTSEDE